MQNWPGRRVPFFLSPALPPRPGHSCAGGCGGSDIPLCPWFCFWLSFYSKHPLSLPYFSCDSVFTPNHQKKKILRGPNRPWLHSGIQLAVPGQTRYHCSITTQVFLVVTAMRRAHSRVRLVRKHSPGCNGSGWLGNRLGKGYSIEW